MTKSNEKTCPYCKQICIGTRSLNRHIASKHSGEKTIMFECKICHKEVEYTKKMGDGCSLKCNREYQDSKKFQIIPHNDKYSFDNIDKHKEEIYKNGKYECPHCDTKLTKYSKIKTHIYKKHTEHIGLCYNCGKENKTENPYCSPACANSREFTEESNRKTTIGLLESYHNEKLGERTVEEFVIEKLNKVHKEYYKYPELEYTNSKDKIKVECPEHGSFEIIYHTHQSGSGCGKCAVSGYKDDKPGILYYLRVEQDNEITYKVGITNNSVKKRYAGYMQYITILHIEEYEIGLHARLREKEILDKYQEHKYEGPSKLGTGNKEVFSHDILSLDNPPVKIYFEGHDLIKNPNN